MDIETGHTQTIPIFVSRSSRDTDVSSRLVWRLEARGLNVREQSQPEDKGINIGEDFRYFMHKATKECRATVALISRHYLASEWCVREAMATCGRDDHQFIPIVIDENCTPDGLLKSFVYLDFAPVRPEDLDRIADLILQVLQCGKPLDEITELTPHLRTASFITNVAINENLPFVGRGDEMARLDECLQGAASTVAITAMAGMGGVGKSYLAQHWAIERRMNYRGVWTLRAEKTSTLIDDLAELAGELNEEQRFSNDSQAAARWALGYLSTMPGKRMLLIYDNAESFLAIRDWLPKQGVHVLVTSRSKKWEASGAKLMELDVLSEEAAVQLLQERAPHLGKEDAHLVAERLGYLPLALSLAAAAMGEAGLTAADYLRDLNARLGGDVDETGAYDPQKTVRAAIEENLIQAARKSEHAPALLELAAFCAPDDIPLELWDDLYADDFLLADPVRRKIAFGVLASWSLIGLDHDHNTLSLHRLVQDVVRDSLEEAGATDQVLAATVGRLDALYQSDPQDVRNWPVLSRLQPHAEAVFSHIDDANAPDGISRLMSNCGLFRATRAEYGAAEPLYRRALAIDKASYGADHPEVAIRLNNLAALLQNMNRHVEAEPLMRRALALDEASYGEDHPSVARDLNNLAQLLQATNRFEEAEPLMRRVLAIDEASFGADHPNVARDLNNLGLLLKATNRFEEAEPLMRRALVIDEASFGADHPNVAGALNNLAQLLQDTNRFAEAEPLMRRAFGIDEASLGADHPNVAVQLNNLAQLLQSTNRLDEAEPLMRRALVIDEDSFGADHPNVAIDLGNLAGILQQTGRARQAVDMRARSLSIMQASFDDPEHPWVKTAQGNWEHLLNQLFVEGWLERTEDRWRLRDEAEGPLPEDQRPQAPDS